MAIPGWGKPPWNFTEVTSRAATKLLEDLKQVGKQPSAIVSLLSVKIGSTEDSVMFAWLWSFSFLNCTLHSEFMSCFALTVLQIVAGD